MDPRRAWARMLVAAAVVIAIDQATKVAVDSSLEQGDVRDLVLGVRLVNVRNPGVAFSSLQDLGPWVGVFAVAALAVLLWYFRRHATRSLFWLPTGMLLGGAIGNIIDRVRVGAVIDFIKPSFWPAFNVADSAVTIGVVLLLWVMERRGAPDGRA